MAWSSSTGRDVSHHNVISDYPTARAAVDWVQIKITEGTSYADPMASQHHTGFAGKPRGAYHFARPVSIPDQVAWFLRRKQQIGPWERPDMLDTEFDGVTGDFIRRLVAEYRRQSGTALVLVYAGLSLLTHACDPARWWDPNCPIWAARYRKTGPPTSPDSWTDHLGWSHPGLAIYQYDNATALPGGGTTDINIQRIALTTRVQEDDMSWDDPITMPGGKTYPARDVLAYGDYYAGENNTILRRVEAQLAASTGQLTQGQADLAAAIKAIPAPGPVTTDQLDQLRDGLKEGLPADLVDEFDARLREHFRAAAGTHDGASA